MNDLIYIIMSIPGIIVLILIFAIIICFVYTHTKMLNDKKVK